MILNLNLVERLTSCVCDKIRIFSNIFWDADLFNYTCKATRTNYSLQATAFPKNVACQVNLIRLFVIWLLTHKCQLMLYPLSNPCFEHVHEGRALMATTTPQWSTSLLMYPAGELSWTLFTLKNGSTNYIKNLQNAVWYKAAKKWIIPAVIFKIMAIKLHFTSILVNMFKK